MKATETNLKELLGGEKQYLVPLYQRTYSWSQKQFEQLWDDLVELADAATENPDSSHFMGSMVLAPSPSLAPAGVADWLVVDGQQRLTTLTLLLAAIRDHSATEDPRAVERIDELYLVNKWASGEGRYKVNPTQLDRGGYRAIIDRAPNADAGEGVAAAYRFFRSRLERHDDPEDPHDIRRIEDAVTSHLSVVVISAQAGDNVHRIFESLNNTGVRLTQADLLRNYFFMRMPTRGESAYHSLWLPMQQVLSSDELEQVVLLDLILRGEQTVRRDEIYRSQQIRLESIGTEDGLEAELRSLREKAELFRLILDPALESDVAVRAGLARLRAWGSQTIYPPVLHLLILRSQDKATSGHVARSLRLLESYLVRRMIVGKATNNLNRILNSLPAEVDGSQPVDEQVEVYLSTGRKYWPTDVQLRAAIETGPFYWRGRGPQRSFVLRRLEESYASQEPVDLSTLTIEHVMPQSPTEQWWEELPVDALDGEDPLAMHSRLVHTLGNLTLTGYNANLSNRPFSQKRELLKSSGVHMNQEIASREQWGPGEIVARADAIATRCIEIWPGPIEGLVDDSDGSTLPRLRELLSAIPPGAWATYGDVAAVLGSHPVAVGSMIGANEVPNGWRILTSQGRISPGFHWIEPDRTDDPVDVLSAEGVVFGDDGAAHPAQRLSLSDLGDLIGVELEEPSQATEDPEQRARFEEELKSVQDADVASRVLALLDRWRGLGGRVVHGTGQEASAILKLLPYGHPGCVLWAGAVYPSGSLAIWFQHLKTKEPFTQVPVREELRACLVAGPDIDIPESKLGLRPSLGLDLLAADGNYQAVDAFLELVTLRAKAAAREVLGPDGAITTDIADGA